MPAENLEYTKCSDIDCIKVLAEVEVWYFVPVRASGAGMLVQINEL